MKQQSKPVGADKLEQVRRDFQTWRARKHKGERIPDRLWAAGTGLVAEYGLSRVSGALGLDYYKLKERSEQTGGEPEVRPEPSALFAELAEPTGGTVCVVELEKGNGTRMRMALGQRASVDWERLADAFLNA